MKIDMSKNDKTKGQIPPDFSSLEEAAEFWDTHSLADYWDQTQEVEIEVRVQRRQWIPLASMLATQVAERAHRQGVSVETLVNLWVAEKLQAGT
jgi:hypothetical protein